MDKISHRLAKLSHMLTNLLFEFSYCVKQIIEAHSWSSSRVTETVLEQTLIQSFEFFLVVINIPSNWTFSTLSSFFSQIIHSFSTDMSSSTACQFDTSLTIRLNHISLNDWETTKPFTNNTIVSTCFDKVSLDQRSSCICIWVADDWYSIIMTLLNLISEDYTLVIDNVDASCANLALIKRNEAVNLSI